MAQVPAIYSRLQQAPPVSWAGRGLAAAVAAGCASMLTVGAMLRPDPSGVGTHTNIPWLHLQPCGLLLRTGVPCPSCGLTTSVSWFAHGNLAASAYVQPMGLVIALAAALAFWIALYVAITGRPAHRLLRLIPPRYYGWPLAALALGGWAWKIFHPPARN